MTYKGVDFTVVPTAAPGIWAELRINRELRNSRRG
jgi:hypothetical protein